MTSKAFDNVVKLNKIYSVIDYGAKGDGVSDDTIALNAAAAAARANGAGLFIPPVTTFYKVSDSLDFTDIKVIDGRGAEIRGTYTNNAAVTIGGTSTGIKEGYIWLAVRSTADKSTTAGNRGIVLRSMSECKLWLYVRGFNEGIYFDGASANRVWVANQFNIIKLYNNTSHVHFDMSGSSYAVKNQFVGGGYYLGTNNIVANQGTFKLTLAGSGLVSDIQVDNPEIGIDYGSWDSATQAVFVYATLNTTWNVNTIEFTNVRYEGYGFGSNSALAVHIATQTLGRLGVSVEIVGSVASENIGAGALSVKVPPSTISNIRLLNKAIRSQAQETIAYPQAIMPERPIVYQTNNAAYIPKRILFNGDYGAPVQFLTTGFTSNGNCTAQNNQVVLGVTNSSFGLRYEKGTTTSFLYLHKPQQIAIVCYDANGAVLSGTSPYYVVGENHRSITRGSIDIYECFGRWVWLHEDVRSFYIGPASWVQSFIAEDVAFDVTFGSPLTLFSEQPLTASELITSVVPTQAFLPAGSQIKRSFTSSGAQVFDNEFYLKTQTSTSSLSGATTIDATTVAGISAAGGDIIGIELDTTIATGLRRYHYSTVTNISGSTLTFADALPANVASGRAVLISRWRGNFLLGIITYDPPSLNDGDTDTTTITVNNAIVGDFVIASYNGDLQGIDLTAWVSAANTVTVKFANRTGGTIDLSSQLLRVQVIRKN